MVIGSGLVPNRSERHRGLDDGPDLREPTHPAGHGPPGLAAARARTTRILAASTPRGSKAASGTSQLIQVARGSTHGAAIPATVASPPISLSTTAEHNRR